jgi:hypothetical protein
MQDIVTKENWSSDPNNAPLPSDFNRIESNIRKVEENRQEETTARQTADTTLQNNIDSEETARVNADTTLQNNIDSEETARVNADNAINADLGGLDFVNGNAGTYGTKIIAQNERWVIPKGTYILWVDILGGIVFQIYSGSVWVGYGNLSATGLNMPLQITSDGVNFAFTGQNTSNPGTIFYRKLA